MTMTCCLISQLSAGFIQPVFSNLTFTLSQAKTGLVAPNGQGKSLLLRCLAQQIAPLAGTIQWQAPYYYLAQLADQPKLRIADALAINQLYDAFARIEQGQLNTEDFQLVEPHWHLPALWQQLLEQSQLKISLDDAWHNLSGGQQQKLKLLFAFANTNQFLLLDEPSNHLDQHTRQWLLGQINKHTSGCLIASHDQELLEHMDAIYELDNLGIHYFSGNFSHYQLQKQRYVQGLTNHVEQLKKQLKQEKAEQQKRLEKQQRREQEGKKLRKSGSQCKLFLDRAKDAAERSTGQMQQAHQQRSSQLTKELQEKQQQLVYSKAQKLAISSQGSQSGLAISLQQLQLPYVKQSLNLTIQQGEHWHIQGDNGSGKSTLLKAIAQQIPSIAGKIDCYGHCIYLDQHFSMLNKDLSAVDYLQTVNPQITCSEWRTLLAGLHMAGDQALKPISNLSGGQQLKVALLAISHQPKQPVILLLDEPENHLDIEAKQLLSSTLANFSGTVLLVSHDAYFVQQSAVNQVFNIQQI